jgi:hypothetical protein
MVHRFRPGLTIITPHSAWRATRAELGLRKKSMNPGFCAPIKTLSALMQSENLTLSFKQFFRS